MLLAARKNVAKSRPHTLSFPLFLQRARSDRRATLTTSDIPLLFPAYPNVVYAIRGQIIALI